MLPFTNVDKLLAWLDNHCQGPCTICFMGIKMSVVYAPHSKIWILEEL